MKNDQNKEIICTGTWSYLDLVKRNNVIVEDNMNADKEKEN